MMLLSTHEKREINTKRTHKTLNLATFLTLTLLFRSFVCSSTEIVFLSVIQVDMGVCPRIFIIISVLVCVTCMLEER
jgi:hypothetical protein